MQSLQYLPSFYLSSVGGSSTFAIAPIEYGEAIFGMVLVGAAIPLAAFFLELVELQKEINLYVRSNQGTDPRHHILSILEIKLQHGK